MKTNMTRDELRRLVNPMLIDELSELPITPITLENGKVLSEQGTWVIFVTQTILPLLRQQMSDLWKYRRLLTGAERSVTDDYGSMISAFEDTWHEHPYFWPVMPDDFEDILSDS